MIIIHRLIVGYNTAFVQPISLTIDSPGIYAIVGPNGSGKSVFLKTLIGLIPPISGTFKIKNLHKYAYVPQSHTANKYFHLSVEDFIKQGFGPKNQITEEECAKINFYIKTWQLSDQIEKSFHELSGGQKARAMIVRALISDPNIIFLDEPLASLDICCQIQLMQILSDLVKDRKAYVFIIDHHLENFKNLITDWIEFSKKHDDNCSFVKFGFID